MSSTSFASYGTTRAIIADMNGDGLPDVVISDDPMLHSISIMLNNSAYPGHLLSEQHYSTGNEPYFDLAVGDLNGDGIPDVVGGGLPAGVAILLGDPAHPGTLLPAQVDPVATTPAGSETIGIALGDINGDGKLDVVLGNDGSAFSLLLGNGDGSLSPSISYPTGPIPKTFYANAVAIADIDGDKLQDVLVGQFFQNSVQVFLHRPSTLPLAISATDQTFSAASVRPGDPVLLTIKVSAFQGIPSGTVTLYGVTNDAAGAPIYTQLAVLPLDSTGTALYIDRSQNGTRSFRSFYPGDQVYAPSTSLIDTAEVTLTPTFSMTLAAAPNPATVGQMVTLTATLAPILIIPTGTVDFLDGGTEIGSAPLSAAGIAVLSTSSLTVGTHTLQVTYAGDSTYPAEKASTTEVIRYLALQLTVTSSLNPAPVGQSVTFQTKLTATGPTPTGTVSFQDAGTTLNLVPLAVDGTASFTTTALTAGTHTIQASYSGNSNFLFGAFFPVLFLSLPVPWRRRMRLMGFAVVLCTIGAMAGCGFSKSPLATPPGTYSIVITGHGAASHLDRSATLTLVVE